MGMQQQHYDAGKSLLDTSAALTAFAAFATTWVPVAVAFLAGCWTLMNIIEKFSGKPFHQTRIAQLVVALVRKILPMGRDKS